MSCIFVYHGVSIGVYSHGSFSIRFAQVYVGCIPMIDSGANKLRFLFGVYA